jgi:SSS family solute:Na+ symporter
MHGWDIAIIALYLVLMIAVGWYVAKLASKSAESYFLAGKKLPWYIIGVAHGSSGIDITGTMWFVTMLFVYGVKAVWLLWVWPLFNVIFRMVYLGTWVRRSNVLTGAEWMRTRFGKTVGAELAYLSVVLYAVVSVVGFLGYAFQGIGKFTKPFLPWAGVSENVYGAVIMAVTGLYCIVGGMYSVVLNDLIQFLLILVSAIVIAAVAMMRTTPEQIMAAVPAGWDHLFPGWKVGLDWSGLIPQLNDKLYNPYPLGDGYSFFLLFVLALFAKGVLVSMAGPTPNYAIQHVLSTRSPREAALENMCMAIVSLAPRFLLIAGIGVLGIVFFSPELSAMGAKVDFEKILPNVVLNYLPVGCKGLILAGLLAAFMSTYVSTVNSGAAYVVNDIYKRYLDPDAPPRRYVLLGYACSLVVILAGIGFGFMTVSVHKITEWIVSALVPAFVIPNVIKWHWWRFNGYGFFAGMVAGTGAALCLPAFAAGLHPVYGFFSILGISTVASVGACLLTKPESDDVLESFYRTIRPWGFWGPIREKIRAGNPSFEGNREFKRDLFNLAVGLVWQTSMVALPIYLVIQQYAKMWTCLIVFAATSVILKFTWYDRLGPGEMYLPDDR